MTKNMTKILTKQGIPKCRSQNRIRWQSVFTYRTQHSKHMIKLGKVLLVLLANVVSSLTKHSFSPSFRLMGTSYYNENSPTHLYFSNIFARFPRCIRVKEAGKFYRGRKGQNTNQRNLCFAE